MNAAFKLKMAKQLGGKVAREHGYTDLPVDPARIAAANAITVMAKPDTAKGVSGMLLRHGDNFGIMYATHVHSEGFRRFSIAHELGHFFLDGHIDQIMSESDIHASKAGFASGDIYEMEADNFASGLLMPERMFKRQLGKADPGFAAVEHVAGVCMTSLEATAIRYAELTEDAIAVVLSTGEKVDYCCLSDGIKSVRGLSWLKRGEPVPKDTATAAFNQDRDRILSADRDEGEIDLLDWLGGEKSVLATEEVIGLGSYGKTLTILHCPSIVDETYSDEVHDEESEEAMIDRWTPHLGKRK